MERETHRINQVILNKKVQAGPLRKLRLSLLLEDHPCERFIRSDGAVVVQHPDGTATEIFSQQISSVHYELLEPDLDREDEPDLGDEPPEAPDGLPAPAPPPTEKPNPHKAKPGGTKKKK